MYMTKLVLDGHSRLTTAYLANPERLHGAIESAFPGERQRRLWRVEEDQKDAVVLIVSEDIPDFSHLLTQYRTTMPMWETRDYDAFLAQLQAGQQWRFRLCANPVHMVRNHPSQRGKVYAHVTVEQQEEWLYDRQEALGITLKKEEFRVVHSQWKVFTKGSKRHRVRLKTAVYEGILTIADPDRFREALIQGIGRGKAYGCGLLTIARL